MPNCSFRTCRETATMVMPIKNVPIVKKRTKKFRRHQADRFSRMYVYDMRISVVWGAHAGFR